ncbi:MAG: hypothetical protein HY237_01720 [Acidobacteria bacterium]|nr:hypothetical protein [Acidobacteriota bacterium]
MNDQNSQIYPSDAARVPTLRDILAPLFRHRRLVVLSFLGIFLGTILSAIVLPKQYEVEMKILVKRERVDPVVTTERNAYLRPRAEVTEEELNSEVELLKSRDLLEKVVLTCGLHQSNTRSFWAAVFPTARATETSQEPVADRRVPRAVRTLEKKLEVEPIRKTSLIRVTYESSDPQLAARVLTTLANLYLEKHVAVHRPPGAFDFFQGETQRYQKELTAAEARLADFDREQGVVAAQLEKEITLQKLNEFDATLQATGAAIVETEKHIQQLEVQLATASPRMTTQIRTSDNPLLLQQLKSTLLSLELKRTELLEKFEPGYRPVQEVEKQIAQAREAIAKAESTPVREETTDRDPSYEWLRSELTRSRTELAALQARAIVTARVVRTYRERVGLIDQKGTVQQTLMWAAKEAEENYLLYLRKQEEARISDALDHQRIVNVAVAEAATVPSLPSRPRWLWTLLLGGVLAVLVSTGLAFASDYFDPSFRTPQELQRFLNIRVVAGMPKDGK